MRRAWRSRTVGESSTGRLEQVGRAAYDPPADGVGAGPKTHMREKGPLIDSVDALDAGNNAQMA